MVHVCVVPNYNTGEQKIHCLLFDNLLSVLTDSLSYTEYFYVGQLVQLDHLLLTPHSNINWIYRLDRCCLNLNRSPSYIIFAWQFHFTCDSDHSRQLQQQEIFVMWEKLIFRFFFPVNHARSNPEIQFAYTQLIMQQIYSLHLRVYSCFQGLTSRDYKAIYYIYIYILRIDSQNTVLS